MEIKTWWERLNCTRNPGAHSGEDVVRDEEIAELRAAIERQAREVLKLHRDLAAEKLRADQGWHRYEAANSRKNELEAERANWEQEIAALKRPVDDQNARWAIDAAIAFGRMDVNRPPTDDHWLMEYWLIGRHLAPLGQLDSSTRKLVLDISLQSVAEQAQTVPMLEDHAEQLARSKWTVKQWYEHVGAWENAQGELCFGSVMALGAMLKLMAKARHFVAPVARQDAISAAKDPIRELIALHAQELDQNDYAYFELARTRRTEWMAWICTNLIDNDLSLKILATGQGSTPEEACSNAIIDYAERAKDQPQ